jgi:hypothetical protein
MTSRHGVQHLSRTNASNPTASSASNQNHIFTINNPSEVIDTAVIVTTNDTTVVDITAADTTIDTTAAAAETTIDNTAAAADTTNDTTAAAAETTIDNTTTVDNTIDNTTINTTTIDNTTIDNTTIDTTTIDNTTIDTTTIDNTISKITLSLQLKNIVDKLYNGVKNIHPNIEYPQLTNLIMEELEFNPKNYNNPTTVLKNVCKLAIETEVFAEILYSLRCYNAYIMQQEWIELLVLDNPYLSRHQICYSLKKRFIDGFLNENRDTINQEKLETYRQALDYNWETYKRCMFRGKPIFEFMYALGLGTACTLSCLGLYLFCI